MNGYGWRSFCRRQGPACHAPRLQQQFLALEKQNQPLEVQPTLQLAHPRNQRESSPWNAALEKQKQPLEVQPTFLALEKQNQPLDLSPRLVQGAPAADRPRMVGPATLALAAAESATPIAHAWRVGLAVRPMAASLPAAVLRVQKSPV